MKIFTNIIGFIVMVIKLFIDALISVKFIKDVLFSGYLRPFHSLCKPFD